MSGTSFSDEKKWQQQRISMLQRLKSFVLRCTKDGKIPTDITMSPSAYNQTAKEIMKSKGKIQDVAFDAMDITIGDKVIHLWCAESKQPTFMYTGKPKSKKQD